MCSNLLLSVEDFMDWIWRIQSLKSSTEKTDFSFSITSLKTTILPSTTSYSYKLLTISWFPTHNPQLLFLAVHKTNELQQINDHIQKDAFSVHLMLSSPNVSTCKLAIFQRMQHDFSRMPGPS